jgi:hypothetical protein
MRNQMLLSRELVAVMRKAVAYAFDAGSEFVELSHVRSALQDDQTIGFGLSETLERKQIHGALLRGRPRKQLRGVESERSPFPIYHSLVIRTPDGKDGKWLDQDSYDVFLEGARRVRAGAYLPKHLAKAYLALR